MKARLKAYLAGADDAEVPPVPIPNTEVKLCRAEDSWLETTCENRQVPAFSFIAMRFAGAFPQADSLTCTLSSVGRAADS